MSWKEDLNTKLTIITGDGLEYTPFWKNAKIVVPYNVTEFNFPETKGTYVDRREPLGNKYTLELYFQGEYHLNETKEFLKSSEDKRPWQIIHPYYGLLNVQPSSLAIDNSGYNVSKITTTVTETIEKSNPVTSIIPIDKIQEDIEFIQDAIIEDLTEPNVALLEEEMFEFPAKVSTLIQLKEDAEIFAEKVNEANNKVKNVVNDVATALNGIADVIAAPSNFHQSMATKMAMTLDNFDNLVNKLENSVDSLINLPNDVKSTFEAMGSYFVNSICLTSTTTNEDDYATKREVQSTITSIIQANDKFIETLDKMQRGTGASPEDYIPSQKTLVKVNNLVNFTVQNLFSIGKNSKQERSEVLLEDSDFITLSHRFYGLKNNDITIDELMSENPLGLNGIINIKKGTKITYFI